MHHPDPTVNELVAKHNKLAEAFELMAREQQKALAQQQRINAQEAIKQFRETLIRVTAETYSAASNYSNIVGIAGYAAFFTIWSGLRDKLSVWSVCGSALFIGLSASIFVMFEIFKRSDTAKLLSNNERVISQLEVCYKNGDFDGLLREVENIKIYASELKIKMIKTWTWSFWPATITGVFAILIIACGTVELLLH